MSAAAELDSDPAPCDRWYTCNLCEKDYLYIRKQKGTRDTCSSCYGGRHRFALKARMVEYMGGGCQVCGFNRSLAALDFHHIDPTEKHFNFGSKHTIAIGDLETELKKCVCLCSNCHRELHEALELVEWGRLPEPIVNRVREIYENWRPPQQPLHNPRGE